MSAIFIDKWPNDYRLILQQAPRSIAYPQISLKSM